MTTRQRESAAPAPLAQGERSVEALAERVGLSMANASQHLRLMRQTGLLASRRDGKRVLYRLNDPSVLELTAALHRVAERNVADVRDVIRGYFHERDAASRCRARSSVSASETASSRC